MIPGQLIASRQLTDPGVNFAWSEVCNSSHEFLFAPGQLREAGYPLYNTRLTGLTKVTFLQVNRTQKLPGGKSSLAHAHY